MRLKYEIRNGYDPRGRGELFKQVEGTVEDKVLIAKEKRITLPSGHGGTSQGTQYVSVHYYLVKRSTGETDLVDPTVAQII